MWRLGRRAVANGAVALVNQSAGQSSFGRIPRRFLAASAGAADAAAAAGMSIPTQRKRQVKKKGGVPMAAVGVGIVGAGAVGYAVSEEFREVIDTVAADAGDFFEDFNDSSREFFERVGDRLIEKRKEPWLLTLQEMNYPDYIPTLVLDLDKVILHLEHDSRQGWHVIKRPFADQFFKEIQHYYEVVIFSDDVFPVALDIATKWNLPVTGVLHRDFCKKKRQHYIKDLSKLGRKQEKVLIIDHDPAAFQLQPDNGLLIRPFEGDPNDSELADLLDFLKAAATSNMDLRKFVGKFGGGDCDIGRRYLVHKKDQDALVQKRRNVSRMLSVTSQPGGFPMNNPSMGSFPR